MSERIPPKPLPEEPDSTPEYSRVGLTALVLIVGLEALLLSGATVWLVIETLVDQPSSIVTAVALTVLSAVIALWLIASTVGLARRQSWSRGSALTWQILQIALSFGAVQGEFAQPVIAAAALVPALVAIGLIVSSGVRSAFGSDSD